MRENQGQGAAPADQEELKKDVENLKALLEKLKPALAAKFKNITDPKEIEQSVGLVLGAISDATRGAASEQKIRTALKTYISNM